MPAGAARTATGISVSISRDPALVRTVRLVAAAVARRAARDEEFVEEVRLAVGEACALLVAAADDSPWGAPGPVEVLMRVEDRLRVSVTALGSVTVEDAPNSDIDGVEPWALLRGLIEDFGIVRDGARTTLTMSWPLA